MKNNAGNESLNLDGESLYFNTSSSIYRLNLTTLAVECVMGGLDFPEGMLVADGQIYVGKNDNFGIRGIVRVATDGTDPMLISEFDRSGSNFRLVGDTLYFSGISIFDGSYYSVSKAGGTPTEVYDEGSGASGYAVIDGYFYVMYDALMRAPVGDTSSWESLTASMYGMSLFEAGGTLYWLADRSGELNASELYSYRPGDADPTEMDELGDAQYLTHNATHLFFTLYGEDVSGTGSIYSYPLVGGAVETIATFETLAIGVATATSDTLYVSAGDGVASGGILRIPLN